MADIITAKLIALGTAIRESRKSVGLSQEEFGHACGLHRTYIGQVERGEKNVSFENIYKMSVALQCSPSALFKKADM